MHACRHASIHSLTHSHTLSHSPPHTLTLTHSPTHTLALSHSHTHTHACALNLSLRLNAHPIKSKILGTCTHNFATEWFTEYKQILNNEQYRIILKNITHHKNIKTFTYFPVEHFIKITFTRTKYRQMLNNIFFIMHIQSPAIPVFGPVACYCLTPTFVRFFQRSSPILLVMENSECNF
jgi:hypothetical protein